MAQSNEPAIDQMNEAIALFCGYKVYDEGLTRMVLNESRLGWPVGALKYHTSWDWLKPVIDRIFEYAIAHPEQVRPIHQMSIVVSIKSAHDKVYKFCNWYNQQKQKDGE